MATQVQNRRGTTAEHTTFTGANGELTVDTTKRTLVVHDGATAGGRPLLREDQSNLPTSAPTTGIYNASGSLAISTNSSERIRIGANGEIGIGGANYGTSGQVLTSAGSGAAPTWQTPAAGNADKIEEGNSSAEVIDTGSDGRFVVTTEGTERLRVTSSGQLLVGTSTDLANYDVQIANANGDGFLSMLSYSSTASYGVYVTLNHSKSGVLGTHTLVANNDMLGTFRFRGSDGSSFVDSAAITAEVDGTPGANDMPGRLVFSTTADGASSPTERMRITSGGTTSTFTTAGNAGLWVGSGSAAGTSVQLIYGTYSATSTITGTNSFTVWTNGNVVNTNNSYGALSDIKLKENIVDAGSQWDDLKALQVRKYNFKEGQTHTQIGLVAQEVELVSPGLVTESPDRDAEGNDLGTVTKSVNYSVLYMKAVKALQEAMERIEQLETEMVAVKAQLS